MVTVQGSVNFVYVEIDMNKKVLVTSALLAAAVNGLIAGNALAAPSVDGISSSTHARAMAGIQLVGDTAGTDAHAEKNSCKGKEGCKSAAHDCKGQNSCKGKGGCKSGDNGCKGKNSCKGKGGCNTKSEEHHAEEHHAEEHHK